MLVAYAAATIVSLPLDLVDLASATPYDASSLQLSGRALSEAIFVVKCAALGGVFALHTKIKCRCNVRPEQQSQLFSDIEGQMSERGGPGGGRGGRAAPPPGGRMAMH